MIGQSELAGMSIVVISTGGTIASTPDEDAEGASPELTGDDLVAAVPEIGEVADIETYDFSNVPSAQFTIKQMGDLVEVVQGYDDDPTVDGVVVTQGTDILEESAYFVDLCYNGQTPVVFTGAMRNASLPSADGPANLLASIRTAAASETAAYGVLVAFNDRIHAAREVTKMNSMNVDTFRSPEFGPLGVVDEGRVTYRRQPTNPDSTFAPDSEQLTSDVHAVLVSADMPEAQIQAAAESSGLCLAATGAGHIPPRIIPDLEDLRAAGVPLVATTRCPEGRLARNTYSFRGSEMTLRELDAYFSDLNLQKTRIKTIVALADGRLDEAFPQP